MGIRAFLDEPRVGLPHENLYASSGLPAAGKSESSEWISPDCLDCIPDGGAIERDDEASWDSAELRSAVLRICNPLRLASSGTRRIFHALPNTIRRYGRLKICATSARRFRTQPARGSRGRYLFIVILLCLAVSSAESKPKWLKAPEGTKTAAMADEIVYRGMCDASAAVAIGTNLVAIATDEENRLRVYRRDRGGLPLQTFDLTAQLGLERHSPECDLEGAARLGDAVYWIGSHSRNQDGKFRPNRHRFFATRFDVTDEKAHLQLLGVPYQNLVSDLAHAPQLKGFDFERSSWLAPKKAGALNIEGLCATPDNQLLIAFRNPVPNGRALLVPFMNPKEVVMKKQSARFGDPIMLELDGLGVRDIAYLDGRYLIIGGSFDGQGHSKLFSWSGPGTRPHPFKNVKLKGLNPEAIAIYPDKGLQEFQLFSDDSSQRQRGKDRRELKDEFTKQFRSVWITHEGEPAQ